MTRPSLPALALRLGGLLLVLSCEGPTTPTETVAAHVGSVANTPSYPPETWTAFGQSPENKWRFHLAAGVVPTPDRQSIVYVLGGRFEEGSFDPPAATILAFDVAGFWTTKSARFTGAETNGTGTIGNILYISGGANFFQGQWTKPTKRLMAYDVAADRVTRKADMPVATSDGVTGVLNGKLYVLAGTCPDASCRRFFRYDPTTNTWADLPPSPNPHRHGAGVVLNGRFYVAGGGASPYRAFDVYNPVTNRWQSLGQMPPSRQFAVGAAAAGKVYILGIAGGERLGSEDADRATFEYDPATNTWAERIGVPGPTGEGGQFLLRPGAALRVVLEGEPRIFTLGHGHLFTDSSVCPPCKPAGTIEPTVNYIFSP
jgi:hypothetical protein